MCASADAREVSYHKHEANLSSKEELVQQIDLSLKGYNRAADEKRNCFSTIHLYCPFTV